MNLELLKNIGLTDGEITIYSILIEHGELSAGQILSHTKLKRGDCYNKIADLVEKGLVVENNRFKVKRFGLEHPNKIEELVENRSKALETTEKELKSLLPSLVSNYNLSHHKPGVKIFEGEESIKKVIADALTAREEIYSYIDPKYVDKYIDSALNKKYIRDLERKGIKNKLLVEDNVYNRQRYGAFKLVNTEVRYLDREMPEFDTTMQIYDNKVIYQTYKPEAVIGIIIEDKLIYRMHRSLFEYTWEKAVE